MRLISIQLKNIKSHRDTELSFSPGINVLCGANGVGKSTVFEAIGYGLFGVDAQDFVSKAERFLSIGAKRGEVSVVFEAVDGEQYRVTRTVGGGGKWLLARAQGDGFEVEDHANILETEARIATLLGLSTARSLADQFKLVIGPFQNEFLGPFVIRQPTKRQTAFDEILGIDAWRRTIEGTKSLFSTIGAKIDTLQAEVAGKLEQVAVLPEKEVELRTLTASAAAKGHELTLGTAAMELVTGRLAMLDAHKEKLEVTQNALLGLQEKVRSGQDYVANQQLLVQQSRAAAAVLDASRPGKLAFDAAEDKLKLLRAEEQQKSLLEKELAALDKDQSNVAATLAIETRELGELETRIAADEQLLAEEEKGQDEALARLKHDDDASRAVLDRVNLALARFRELPVQRIENTLPYLVLALDQMASLDAKVAGKRDLVAGAADVKAKAGELSIRQQELERVQQERAQLTGKKQSLIEGSEKIGAGACPFFQEPCQNLPEGGGVEVFTARIEQLDQEIAGLDGTALSLSVRLKEAQEAALQLAGIEQVARELEAAGRERGALEAEFAAKLDEIAPNTLVSGVQEFLAAAELSGTDFPGVELALDGGPQERRRQLEAWSDSWHRVLVSLEQQLTARVKQAEEPVQSCALKLRELDVRNEALDRKRRDLAANREKLAQRQKTIMEHQGWIARLGEGVARKKEALSLHAGLEARIATAAEELERFQAERDRFIANEQAAGELDKRSETLGKYQARLQELETGVKEKAEELRVLKDGYQAELHDEAKREREGLVSSLATLQAEIAGLGDGTARLEKEIAALTEISGEIEKKLAAIEKLKEQGNLVKFLRGQVFKNVSTQLSERFREEISFRADRIYRSIAESDEELFWGENYQIVLKDMADGVLRERTDDQLSGGQMMSAVVALRLALLQTIGARIAFFDEPTSNLDAERRENLARAFRAIDVGKEEVTEHWYDQLFLVSHDVSFTEITDQMILLDK